MLPVLIPYAIQYGIPAATFVVGHIIGWARHRRKVEKVFTDNGAALPLALK